MFEDLHGILINMLIPLNKSHCCGFELRESYSWLGSYQASGCTHHNYHKFWINRKPKTNETIICVHNFASEEYLYKIFFATIKQFWVYRSEIIHLGNTSIYWILTVVTVVILVINSIKLPNFCHVRDIFTLTRKVMTSFKNVLAFLLKREKRTSRPC